MFFVITSARADRPSAVAAQRSAEVATAPIDKLTAYDVAANLAKAVDLPEKTPITNQAQSAKVAVIVSASDAAIATKPQVVSTALKSWRDISEYPVVAGDTVSSVAQKFGVTSESIRWSNGLSGDVLTAGNELIIPPVNGVVYTVKNGDTPQTIAAAYHTTPEKVIEYNDAENGLVVGRRIIIPDGKIVPVTPARTTTYVTNRTVIGTSSFTPSYGANGYDWGWCTYYAAARSGAPGNWGNANTWAYYARLSGWTVSSTPVPGAIFQTPSGWAGHVGIVDEVYGNGTMKISDMNGISGFGRVGSAVVSVSTYPNYIYR